MTCGATTSNPRVTALNFQKARLRHAAALLKYTRRLAGQTDEIQALQGQENLNKKHRCAGLCARAVAIVETGLA